MDYYKYSPSTKFKSLEEAQRCAFAIAQGANFHCVFYDSWQQISVPKCRAMMSTSFRDLIDAARSHYFSSTEHYEAYCSEECARRVWRKSTLAPSCGNRLMVCKCPKTGYWRVGRIGRLSYGNWEPVTDDYYVSSCRHMSSGKDQFPWSMGKDSILMLYPSMEDTWQRSCRLPGILRIQLAGLFAEYGFEYDKGAGYIYGLKDVRHKNKRVRDNTIRYVGQTVDLHKRYKTHLFNAHSEKLKNWVAEIIRDGSYPIPVLLEVVEPGDSINEREELWIDIKKREKCDLLNTTHM